MRILHVYKDYHPILGGIENHIKTLAEAQAAAGHDVTVLVTNPGRQMAQGEINGVRLVRAWRLATVASTPISPMFPLLLARQQPDVTHLHFPYPVGEVSQWLVGGERPYVITYHSDVVKQQAILRLYKPLLERVLAGAAAIIASSRNYVQSSPFLRPLAAKCTPIPFAVDCERFRAAEPLLPPAEQPTLLFIGRHRYYKGIDDLIRAMVDLPARLIIGGDGPQRPTWEALAKELDLLDQIQFVGNVPDADLPRFYASGDVFVLPANARAEAFGKVLQEAMAAGLPCVTTELGTGTSYVVQHEKTGLVVPPGQPQALAAAIQRLLADPERRRQLGAAGQERACKEFTLVQMVEGVTAVYQRVLNQAE